MLYMFLFLTIQVEMKDNGKIYKIRIGHDGSSQHADWMLEKVRFLVYFAMFLIPCHLILYARPVSPSHGLLICWEHPVLGVQEVDVVQLEDNRLAI